MNQEIREEIRRIQAELRKPFAPEVHGIRELPGRGYWAFVSHHEYRERLDEVYPEWEAAYTHIEQIASDVICKCTITILGISKQAIGSVPLVAAEKNGKDVSRGSAADRVAAEAFKNACEAWGVGRYLDKQGEVAYYLNSHATKLDYETRNKLAPLANYLRGKGELPPANSNTVVPKLETPNSVVKPVPVVNKAEKVITEEQAKALWTLGKPLGKELLQSIVKSLTGANASAEIPATKYNALIKQIEKEVAARTAPDSLPQANEAIPQSQTDRDLLAQEINSLRKRKNLDPETVKKIMLRITGKEDDKQCTDLELLKVRDELALHPAMAIAN